MSLQYFLKYRPLNEQESLAIYTYMERHDPTLLTNLINSDVDMSMAMRCFIADAINGKLERPSLKTTTAYLRNFNIYHQTLNLQYEGHKLTSGWKDGAAQIVAVRFGLTEVNVLKIYKRYRDKYIL